MSKVYTHVALLGLLLVTRANAGQKEIITHEDVTTTETTIHRELKIPLNTQNCKLQEQNNLFSGDGLVYQANCEVDIRGGIAKSEAQGFRLGPTITIDAGAFSNGDVTTRAVRGGKDSSGKEKMLVFLGAERSRDKSFGQISAGEKQENLDRIIKNLAAGSLKLRVGMEKTTGQSSGYGNEVSETIELNTGAQ